MFALAMQGEHNFLLFVHFDISFFVHGFVSTLGFLQCKVKIYIL